MLEPNDDSMWMVDAACRRIGGDDWFPSTDNSAESRKSMMKAKLICKTECPVRKRCLNWALKYNETWGIWGGVNLGAATTRRRLRQQLAISEEVSTSDDLEHGTEYGYQCHIRTMTKPCHSCIKAASEARRNRRGA